MKLIKPSYSIIEQECGLNGIYKQIELAGRTCYKSEDKITEDSAKGFVDRMIKSGHGAMLEHGTVYLHMEFDSKEAYFNDELALKYHNEPHTKAFRVRDVQTEPNGKQHAYITTNLRVLVENEWLDDLKYLCEPTKYHMKRYTVKFTTDQGILREFSRHRVFSFAVESTRYCNYSKDKFGNELTFIIPEWCPEITEESVTGWDPCTMYDKFFLQHLQNAEDTYFALLKQWDERVPDKRYKTGFRNNPWTPQQARNVLPLATKCEIVMTGFASDWKHFFNLRYFGTTGAPHPQAYELAKPLYEEFITRCYIR